MLVGIAMMTDVTSNTIMGFSSIERRGRVAQLFDFIRDIDAAVGDDALEYAHPLFEPFGLRGVLGGLFGDQIGFQVELAVTIGEPGLDEGSADDRDQAARNAEDGNEYRAKHRSLSSVAAAQYVDLASDAFGGVGGDPFEHPEAFLEPADLAGQALVLRRQQVDLALCLQVGIGVPAKAVAAAMTVLQRKPVLGPDRHLEDAAHHRDGDQRQNEDLSLVHVASPRSASQRRLSIS